MAIRIKPGVMISHLSFACPQVMGIIYQAQLLAPDSYEVTITSGCDGMHAPKSKHYTGKAFDLRIFDFPGNASPVVWAKRLQRRLGDEYFVLLEKTHLHLQWNG